jgi:hypothetical protein
MEKKRNFNFIKRGRTGGLKAGGPCPAACALVDIGRRVKPTKEKGDIKMTNQEAQNMKWYITFSDGTGKGEKGVPIYYFSTKSGEKEIPGNLVSRWFHIEPFIEAAQSGKYLSLNSQDIDSREADRFYIHGIVD